MERPPKQFELFEWPPAISPDELMEELNDEFRRAGNYGKRKGEDLVSKEETTKALEKEGAKPVRVLSSEESAAKAKEFIELREKLEQAEASNRKDKGKKK